MDPSQDLAAEYSAIAEAYAQHWAPVICLMAQPLLRSLPHARASRILDVRHRNRRADSGTARHVPHAWLVGIDRAEGMLQIARRAVSLACAVVDAEQLAFRSRVFDVAILAFVLFHFPDPVPDSAVISAFSDYSAGSRTVWSTRARSDREWSDLEPFVWIDLLITDT
jgi:hypothetical protein